MYEYGCMDMDDNWIDIDGWMCGGGSAYVHAHHTHLFHLFFLFFRSLTHYSILFYPVLSCPCPPSPGMIIIRPPRLWCKCVCVYVV